MAPQSFTVILVCWALLLFSTPAELGQYSNSFYTMSRGQKCTVGPKALNVNDLPTIPKRAVPPSISTFEFTPTEIDEISREAQILVGPIYHIYHWVRNSEKITRAAIESPRWVEWMAFEVGLSLKDSGFETDIYSMPFANVHSRNWQYNVDLLIRNENKYMVQLVTLTGTGFPAYCRRMKQRLDFIKKPIELKTARNQPFKRCVIGIVTAASLLESVQSFYSSRSIHYKLRFVNETNYLERVKSFEDCKGIDQIHIPKTDSPNGMGYFFSYLEAPGGQLGVKRPRESGEPSIDTVDS